SSHDTLISIMYYALKKKGMCIMSTQRVNKRKKFEFPHGFVILFSFMILTAITTYFIPAGEYERTTDENGQSIVVDGTYHTVDSNPTGFMDLFNSLHIGMVDAAEIIFFIFI